MLPASSTANATDGNTNAEVMATVLNAEERNALLE